MNEADPRALIERLARERGDDFASLSRLLGRNAAYVQQFVRRGTPVRLPERERGILADHWGIDEALLGAPERAAVPRATVRVDRYEALASAGSGAIAGDDRALGSVEFSERWARRVAGGDPGALSTITVKGDSMAPTLGEGDEILVNRGDAAARLRDGIYVLRIEDALVVKRVVVHPGTRRLTIVSDNAFYPPLDDVDPADVEVIGRVVSLIRQVV